MMEDTILEVKSLRTSFTTDAGSVQSAGGITFQVGKGESLGIARESGRGKSTTMLSIMGLLEDNVSWQVDTLLFNGRDLLRKFPRGMRKIQGNRIGMIFQDPMTSPNPLFTVGEQVRGPLMCHQKLSRKEAEVKALAMLEVAGLPSPRCRLEQHPHEFSGGMRQRMTIATAAHCKPELLTVDEPTTALDVTIQAQILELMAHTRSEFNTSVILTTHDLGVISSLCTRVIVIYEGLIMEKGNIEDIFYRTGHLYAAGFLAFIPKRTKEKLVLIFGTSPDLSNPLKGYPLMTRCSRVMKLCAVRQPPFYDLGNGHISACRFHNGSAKVRMGEVKLRQLGVLIPIAASKQMT